MQQWSLVLALMCVASLVEAVGISQVFAFLPLYIAGIIGPAIGAIIVGAGVPAVFIVSGVVFFALGTLIAVQMTEARRQRTDARRFTEERPRERRRRFART